MFAPVKPNCSGASGTCSGLCTSAFAEASSVTEASGSFDESAAAYLYQYQYVTNINKIDDFYVVAEIYRGEDGTVTKTGNLFAVNAYTRELYKLQTDESGRHYTLGDRLDI